MTIKTPKERALLGIYKNIMRRYPGITPKRGKEMAEKIYNAKKRLAQN